MRIPQLVQCGSLCIRRYSEYLFPQTHIEIAVFNIFLTHSVTLDETDRLCAQHSTAASHSALSLNSFNLYFEWSPSHHKMQTLLHINRKL